MRLSLLLACAVAASLVAIPRQALADAASNVTGHTQKLVGGAAVYEHVCQGCHMPDGKGAIGAGGARFPALAGNAKLQDGDYPVYVVLNGYGGMPWFSHLSDQQIADVANYVRTHFGNHFAPPLTAADVAGQRPAPQNAE